MKPYGFDVMNVRAQYRGFRPAVARFEAAAKQQDPVAAYHPLFEALSWTASLDLRIGWLWQPDREPLGEDWFLRLPGAEAIPGLRWARNTVHHDWANALILNREGGRFPVSFPITFFEWVWHDAAELPANHRMKGRRTYVALLAGRPARYTLQILAEYFEEVAALVAPRVAGADYSARPVHHAASVSARRDTAESRRSRFA